MIAMMVVNSKFGKKMPFPIVHFFLRAPWGCYDDDDDDDDHDDDDDDVIYSFSTETHALVSAWMSRKLVNGL